MENILLVEDSVPIQQLVEKALESRFLITSVSTVEQAETALKSGSFQMILLDVELPDRSGFDFCAEIKKSEEWSTIPLFFLSGKTGLTDKVLGLTLGADDYIVKPFEPLELRARVESRLNKEKRKIISEEVLKRGDLSIYVALHRVYSTKNGNKVEINLTPIEYKILVYLAKNVDRVITREQLLSTIWGGNLNVADRVVDKHIWSVRKKLGDCSAMLETVATVGYKFTVKSE